MSDLTTEVYTRPGCRSCVQVKSYFDREAVKYEEKQLTEEIAVMAKTLGFMEAPVIITKIEDPSAVHVHTGYNEEILHAIVDLHTYH